MNSVDTLYGRYLYLTQGNGSEVREAMILNALDGFLLFYSSVVLSNSGTHYQFIIHFTL